MTLQYCGGFAIHRHKSATVYLCPPILNLLPHPFPLDPSGLSQSTRFECHTSCIELVIYFTYGNTHVSMLFSQIIPLSPSPTEFKICSLHMCLFCCLAYRVVTMVFLNPIYMCQYTTLIFLFLAYFV